MVMVVPVGESGWRHGEAIWKERSVDSLKLLSPNSERKARLLVEYGTRRMTRISVCDRCKYEEGNDWQSQLRSSRRESNPKRRQKTRKIRNDVAFPNVVPYQTYHILTQRQYEYQTMNASPTAYDTPIRPEFFFASLSSRMRPTTRTGLFQRNRIRSGNLRLFRNALRSRQIRCYASLTLLYTSSALYLVHLTISNGMPYPASAPYDEGFLPVSDIHTL